MPTLGQILSFDQNPPNLTWRQINTPTFQLIYTSEFEKQAQLLSSKLEKHIELLARDSGTKPRKISIILQNQSVLSNGFVQLAPRRSEFVVTPPPAGEMEDWLNHLAIHELRHVTQFDRVFGSFKAPFLEQLGLAIYGIALPAWFFEGDAVVAETRLGSGGRGRIPSWLMPLRTNLLEGKTFSYQKNYLGSYRDVTPGFYELGYVMSDHINKQLGDSTPLKILDRIRRNPLKPYNFSKSLSYFSGYTTKEWHEKTLKELLVTWERQLDTLETHDYEVFPETSSSGTKKTELPSNWILPHALADGNLIALHYGYAKASEIVLLDSLGVQKKRLAQVGWQSEHNYSYNANKLVWDELRLNPRYKKQNYSIIKALDLKTGKSRQLTSKSRLFSPSLSADGSRIASVQVQQNNDVSIVILDWASGKILDEYPLPTGIMVQTPSYHSSGEKLIMVAISSQGANLMELNLMTRSWSLLQDWAFHQLERPVYWGDLVIAKAHTDGIDNIHLFQNGDLQKITHVKYGAFNPHASADGNLYFNNYQQSGLKISKTRLPSSLKESQQTTLQNLLVDHLPPTQDFKTYTSKPYKEALNLFNFHSISITSGDFSSIETFNPGVYWLSDNLLNTLQTRLGYIYDGNTRGHNFEAQLNYQRYYPIFSLRYRNQEKVGAIPIPNEENKETLAGLRWRQHETKLKISLPLSFYKNNHRYSVGLSAGTTFTQRYSLSSDIALSEELRSGFVNQLLFPLEYSASFSRYSKSSYLQLAPRWGQYLSLNYKHSPFYPKNNKQKGEFLSLKTTWYFPGIRPLHALAIRANYQRKSAVYQPVNEIPMVSGFDQLIPQTVHNTLLFSYHFPIAYPDWEIGAAAYIKRLKGSVFADFQNINRRQISAARPRTFGVELRSDINFLRFYLPNFDIGAKLIYAHENPRPDRFLVTYSLGYSY